MHYDLEGYNIGIETYVEVTYVLQSFYQYPILELSETLVI